MTSKKKITKKIGLAAVAITMAASMCASTALPALATTVSNSLVSKDTVFSSDYDSMDETLEAGSELNLQYAAESFVLLKNKLNEEGVAALPLAKTERKVTVLGMGADNLSSGGGSGSQSRPSATNNSVIKDEMATIYDGLEEYGIKYNYRVRAKLKADGSIAGDCADTSNYMDEITDGTAEVEYAGHKYKTAAHGVLTGADDNISVYGDAAIVVISRTGSEGYDNGYDRVDSHGKYTLEHNQELNYREREMIAYAKLHFDKVIVVINSPSVMEVGDLEDDDAISSIIWMGQPGWNGALALGGILTGDINPSGKTVDFWMRDFTSDPTWYNSGTLSQVDYLYNGNYDVTDAYQEESGDIYTAPIMQPNASSTIKNTKNFHAVLDYAEGIYMGYRYYETVAADLGDKGEAWYKSETAYPFGFGLSYTSFKQEILAVKGDIAKDDTLTVSVKVTNLGTVPGKDVVQIYSSAPYTVGGIEKAAKDLIGFTKTGNIKAGKSQVVEVEVDVQDISAFDYNDANDNNFCGWELEAGNYTITAGKNSHTAYDTEVLEVKTARQWDENGTEIVNNIFSQEDGAYEQYNSTAYHWTTSGEDHYMTRGDLALGEGDGIKLGLLEFKDAAYDAYHTTGDKKAVAVDEIKRLAWTLTSDNDWKEDALRILDSTGEVSNSASTDGGVGINGTTQYDKDWDNMVTATIETDFKNPWTKEAADIPTDWTQQATASVEQSFADMRGVPYDDAKWTTFLNNLTWEDLICIADGVTAIDSLPILDTPGVFVEHGGTVQSDGPGQLKGSLNGYAWACEVNIASTWNTELAYKQGRIVGNEALWMGTNSWYGPACDTHRNPLGGRNFEYYSQDGVQAGYIAAAVCKGAIDMGLHTDLKHCFMNEQESSRQGGCAFATEQTMRQIYARPFQIAIEKGNCNGLMNSFVRFGLVGSTSYAISYLLYTVEWGYYGYTQTDAYAGSESGWPSWLLVRGMSAGLSGSFGGGGPCPNALNGIWDVTANCVQYTINGKKVNSYTQWYWTRETAHRAAYRLANTNVVEIRSTLDMNREVSATQWDKLSVDAVNPANVTELNSLFGDSGYTITVTGRLPAGISYNAKTGKIEGVPTESGTFNATVTAKGNYGMAYTSRTGKITITIDAAKMPDSAAVTTLKIDSDKYTQSATVGVFYTSDYTITPAVTLTEGENYVPGGGLNEASTGKYISEPIYSATNLPRGLSINPKTGVITGTPEVAGTFRLEITATYKKVVGIDYGTSFDGGIVNETYTNNQVIITVPGFNVTVNVNAPTGTQTIEVGAAYGATLTKTDIVSAVEKALNIGTGWKVDADNVTFVDSTEATTFTLDVKTGLVYPDLVIINGELWISGENTGIKVEGTKGETGATGEAGKDGQDGVNGVSVVSFEINDDGDLIVTLSDGTSQNVGHVVGADGQDGQDGQNGKDGQDGQNGQDGKSGCNSSLSVAGVAPIAAAFLIIGATVIIKKSLKKKD